MIHAERDDMQYGEPVDRELPLLCKDETFEAVYETSWSKHPPRPGRSALLTFIDEAAYEKLAEHAASDLGNEVGGALLGEFCFDSERDQHFVLVTKVFNASPDVNESFASPSLMRFTHTFIRELDRFVDDNSERGNQLTRLGMYHSHPGYTVFMSATDTQTFRTMFFERWHISIIIDPINRDVGVFYWKEDRSISEKSGFYLFRRPCGPL